MDEDREMRWRKREERRRAWAESRHRKGRENGQPWEVWDPYGELDDWQSHPEQKPPNEYEPRHEVLMRNEHGDGCYWCRAIIMPGTGSIEVSHRWEGLPMEHTTIPVNAIGWHIAQIRNQVAERLGIIEGVHKIEVIK
jgi:hypothetical protein